MKKYSFSYNLIKVDLQEASTDEEQNAVVGSFPSPCNRECKQNNVDHNEKFFHKILKTMFFDRRFPFKVGYLLIFKSRSVLKI